MSDWVCRQSGQCCEAAGAVTMTRAEWARVHAARPEVSVIVRDVSRRDGRVEILAAAGGTCCPFYEGRCTVYDVRPGACRAYGCFRQREGMPFVADSIFRRYAESAGVRRVADRMVAAADAWTARCAPPASPIVGPTLRVTVLDEAAEPTP